MTTESLQNVKVEEENEKIKAKDAKDAKDAKQEEQEKKDAKHTADKKKAEEEQKDHHKQMTARKLLILKDEKDKRTILKKNNAGAAVTKKQEETAKVKLKMKKEVEVMDNLAESDAASNYDPYTKTKEELISEITKLRETLDNTKAKVVKQELSCKTKLKRIENRMSLLKMELKEKKDVLTSQRGGRRKTKSQDQHVIRLQKSLSSQAKKCTKEIERMNSKLRQCERGL